MYEASQYDASLNTWESKSIYEWVRPCHTADDINEPPTCITKHFFWWDGGTWGPLSPHAHQWWWCCHADSGGGRKQPLPCVFFLRVVFVSSPLPAIRQCVEAWGHFLSVRAHMVTPCPGMPPPPVIPSLPSCYRRLQDNWLTDSRSLCCSMTERHWDILKKYSSWVCS